VSRIRPSGDKLGFAEICGEEWGETDRGMGRVRVKTVGKILGNTGSVFSYFWSFSYYSVNTIIGTKMGYSVTGIGRNTVGLSYRLFSD
jgi:hypothetical protein